MIIYIFFISNMLASSDVPSARAAHPCHWQHAIAAAQRNELLECDCGDDCSLSDRVHSVLVNCSAKVGLYIFSDLVLPHFQRLHPSQLPVKCG